MIKGIHLNNLPRTILDAIMVTRKLGMRFLWVDSLCIIQDSEDDKIHELAAMGEVYKNSSVKIAAGNAKKVEDGFLSDRPMELCPVPITLEPKTPGTVYLEREEEKSALDDPLFRRGWTFQKFILSRRVILYDKFQATLSCPEVEFRGLNSNLITYNYITKSELTSIIHTKFSRANWNETHHRIKKWPTLIREPSTREFTYFKDRLPAIAGIAKDLCGLWKEEYVAGLWRGFIVNQLGWYRLGVPQVISRVRCSSTRSPALEKGLDYLLGHRRRPRSQLHSMMCSPDAQLIDCHIKLASSETPFGGVLDGRLVLRATIVSLDVESPNHKKGKNKWFWTTVG